MTHDERERDTLPPDTEPRDGYAEGMLSPAGFRRILGEVVGDKLQALHTTCTSLETKVDDLGARLGGLERRVTTLENLRHHYPFALSLLALAVAFAALVAR